MSLRISHVLSPTSLFRFAVLLALIPIVPIKAHAGNAANFVLYNHHTPEALEKEAMFMTDIGQEPDGTRYTAQMIELEVGITDRLATELMIEGQSTFGEGGYNFTGFRWENRYRLFEYGTPLNPVLYVEYEDLSEDTKYVMEVSGRTDAAEHEKARPRERVLETRLILGQDITERLDVGFNWINESDLDTGVTAFGYAAGLNYKLAQLPGKVGHREEEHGYHPEVRIGIEVYGGIGDSDKGMTLDAGITEHYLAPNILFHPWERVMIKVGGAIGLTNASQDIVRTAIGYEF